MKKRLLTVLLVFVLAASMILPLSGCTQSGAADLMTEVQPQQLAAAAVPDAQNAAVTGFAVRLLQNSASESASDSVLISPLSMLAALSMTANGAEGETLAQMEAVLGLPVDTLNSCMHAYQAGLPDESTCKVHLANSIWFTDHSRFTAEQDFLQTNADYFGAGIYQAPFDDRTCREINNWVADNTDGMIRNILDEIPDSAVMYLINALSFDAEWQNIYTKNQISSGTFTTEDGTQRSVEMMHSSEFLYLEDEQAAGFVKHYAGGRYAFAALLPDEGVRAADYVAGLSGERLHALLAAPQEKEVIVSLPVFESEYSADMCTVLTDMGMTDVFDQELADLSGLGHSEAGNIYISRVLHKTYISVNEKGTRAGAATVVEASDGAAAVVEEPKRIVLDRPFVYMIVDCENGFPLFIGTMMDTGR